MASKGNEEMFLTCEDCDITFTGIKPFQQHLKGKQHKKKIDDTKKQIKTDEDSCLEEKKDSNDQDYTCKVCEKLFTGEIPYIQHLKSKHHAKVVQRKNAEDDPMLLQDSDSDSESSDSDDADLSEVLRNILPVPFRSCSVCEKQFTEPLSYLLHKKSKSHAKRKSELQLLKKIKAIFNLSEVSDSEEIRGDGKKKKSFDGVEEQDHLKCKICNRVFSGAVSFAQHMTSKTHAKKERQNKLQNEIKAMIMLQLGDDSSSSSSEDEDSSEVFTCDICNVASVGPENMKAHLQSKKHQRAIKLKKYIAKKVKSTEDDSKAKASLEGGNDTEKPSAENEAQFCAKSERLLQ